MSVIIKNDFIELEINKRGAEMVRFFDIVEKQDILWEKNEDIWKFKAPFLFPKVGSLQPNRYEVDGQKYELANHGFLRTSMFEIEEDGEDFAVLLFSSTHETKVQYPFDFEVRITYKLIEKNVDIKVEITNKSVVEMPFEFGYHPAFKTEKYTQTKIVFPTQLVERYSFYNKPELKIKRKTRNVIHLAQRFFDRRHTMIYKGINSEYVLFTPNYKLKMETKDFPYVAVWSSDESFVCVEPWSNLPDLYPNEKNWIDREEIYHLGVDQTKEFNLRFTLIKD